MPKTAICFSGELRSIEKTLPLIQEKVLSKFSDYDIFYFTWTDDPQIDKLKYLIKTNKIKDIELKPRPHFTEDVYFPKKPLKTNYQNIIRQLYCVKEVNDLKCRYENENHFKYDIVVRIRPDLKITEGELPSNFELGPFDRLYTLDHDNWHGTCDRFYISNSPIMDIVSNRIEGLRSYSELGGSQQYEGFLHYILALNEIPTEQLSLKTRLLRPDGSEAGELVSIERGELVWKEEPELKEFRLFHIEDNSFI